MQQPDQSYGAVGQPAPMPIDEELLASLRGQMNEAAERVSFHECEIERWRRIGYATAGAVRTLERVMPVPQTTPDQFDPDATGKSANPFADQPMQTR